MRTVGRGGPAAAHRAPRGQSHKSSRNTSSHNGRIGSAPFKPDPNQTDGGLRATRAARSVGLTRKRRDHRSRSESRYSHTHAEVAQFVPSTTRPCGLDSGPIERHRLPQSARTRERRRGDLLDEPRAAARRGAPSEYPSFGHAAAVAAWRGSSSARGRVCSRGGDGPLFGLLVCAAEPSMPRSG